MATKPATLPRIWASNPTYLTGPFVGLSSKSDPGVGVAAEGHRPGAAFPTAAEHQNYEEFWTTTWVATWLALGSATGAADAHIVETDTTGATTIRKVTVNDLLDETALAVFSAAAGLTVAMLVTVTGGGTAIGASIGNTGGTGFQTATGSGAGATGYEVRMASTPITGEGFFGSADAGTIAPIIRLEHFGSGAAVQVTHVGSGTGAAINQAGSGTGLSVTSAGGSGLALSVTGNGTTVAANFTGGAAQAAIQALSGNNAIAAVAALGVGSAVGVDASGGNNAAAVGVRGTAINANANGVHGRTAIAAGSGAGVVGEGRGTGQIGVMGVSMTGPAFLFQGDSSSPLHPLGRFVPQDSDPTSSTQSGDFTFGVQNQIRYCVAGHGYKPVLSMPTVGSAVLAVANQVYNTSINYGSSLTTVVTASCLASQGNGFFSSALGHTVKIRFTADVRTGVAATDYANVQIQDFTTGAAVPIATWTGAGTGNANGFALPVATTDWQRVVLAECSYAPVNDGDLIIRAQMSRVTNNQFVRNGRLEVIGSFS